MGGGSFALPFLRTEMPLQDIPVFRMAYSAPTAHRSVSSETIVLLVRCAHPPMPHRTSSSSCSGVPVGLFSEKALQLFLQNARPSAAMRLPMGGGSFALPLLRTEMPLQDIPMFRTAYSAPTAHRAVSSETLMLQVRCAHPPMPHPLSCPCRTDLSSVQKTPHLFSDGQTGGSSARTILFPLPG